MKTIDLVYFDAGGGHRAAAQALQEAAALQQRPWRVRLVNLTRVLDAQSSFRRLTGFEPEDYYNLRLRRGWTLGLGQELKLLQMMIRLGHAPMVRLLQRHWQRSAPDLVVSLVPNFNRALFEGLRQAAPQAGYITVLTDLADHPPHFWIEPRQAQTFVCGTGRAVQQALQAGVPPQRVHATSGMVLRPAFHAPPMAPAERAAHRRQLGLPEDRPLGLVMFGGHGSVQMLAIARRLDEVPLLFACGHNVALRAELQALRRPAPHAALGFTQDIPQLMDLADFFIGKPGPGSLSEAVQRGLPVIALAPTGVMPQERYNVQWVRDHGLGLAVRTVRALRGATAHLLGELPAYQAQVRARRNEAVWEVLEIIAQELAAGEAAVARTAQGSRQPG
ncbi:galactosyldiacylglycerol synthase [Aquincola tertiaricarbonis]|uniref:galactosyldiacylglycerol synthase n=1 Tax=Aquincola tertiaricarbonis TaxID=391953 RepID=UPI0006153F88|nr:galactosyldiacylglycerol synthase [Aquincola tertiaricarbonis]